MTEKQIRALMDCAELVKDFVNATQGDEPYTNREIFELGMKALNDLHDAGVQLAGEY